MVSQNTILVIEPQGNYQIEATESGMFIAYWESDPGQWTALAVTKTAADAQAVIKAKERYLAKVRELEV